MASEVIIIDRDRIQKSFDEIETQKSLLTNCIKQWENLSSHFTSLEKSLSQKTQILDTKLQTLDLETKKSLAKISERENTISKRESIAIKLIEEQKQTALKEIEKTKLETLDCNNGHDIEEALKSYCRKMNSKGILKYMISQRKYMRVKIVVAIRECVDPYRFVLDGIEEFLETKVGVSDKRWACGNLIQGLLDGNNNLSVVATSVKERAGVIAEAWKGKMDNLQGGDDVGPAEAAMFLQMVIGFGLKAKFEEEFLKKLVLSYPSRREMPKLAAGLGFGDKMGDVIDELVKNGKEIESVDFACECGLTERFPPVPSLRAYLKNSRKNVNTMLKNGNYSAAQSEAANALELNSLKAIIRCVQEHKLGAEFNLDSLIKRVSQLEKPSVDRKKSIPMGNKPQTKRSRGGPGGSAGSRPPHFKPAKAGRSSNTYPSYSRRNPVPPVHHPHPATGYSGMFNYPNQPIYDVPPSTSTGGSYVGHSRSPAAVPPTYAYQPEDMAGAGVARSSIAPLRPQPPMYGGYDYSGATAPATYQPSFLSRALNL